MVFCNINTFEITDKFLAVTILILIDGFLQFKNVYLTQKNKLESQSLF